MRQLASFMTTWPSEMSRRASTVVGIAAIAASALTAVLLVAQAPAASDPPLGSHCSCDRGICPLDANGRRCSCGCAKRVDAQPLQRLDAAAAVTCSEGRAGAYPCREIDLIASRGDDLVFVDTAGRSPRDHKAHVAGREMLKSADEEVSVALCVAAATREAITGATACA